MKTLLDCIPCVIRQSLDAARSVTADETIHEHILREALRCVSETDLNESPPALGRRIHARIRELSGMADPYGEAKARQNQAALAVYPYLSRQVNDASNPLEMAVRLATAGNAMDLAIMREQTETEIRESVTAALEEPWDGRIQQFAHAVEHASRILYLADNAGEIVFDRLLVEQLPLENVVVAVRGAPVINDATMADAKIAGITDLVTVIDNGSDAPGTILADCNELFLRHFSEADLIISKGQGNYETLRGSPRPVYFLLRAKCDAVARDLGCSVGQMILRPSHALAPAASMADKPS